MRAQLPGALRPARGHGRQHLGGDLLRRVGHREPAAAAAISSRAASTASVSARSRSGVSSASGRITAAPASAIQRALVVWWSAEACGYGISTAGRPYWASSKTEPPERRDRGVGGGQRDAERRQVLEQDVVRAGRVQVREVARAGDVDDAVRRIGERLAAAWLIERAPSEPPKTSTHVSSAPMPSCGARVGAVGRPSAGPGGRSRGSGRRRGPRAGTRGRRGARGRRARGWSGRGASRPRRARAGSSPACAASPTGPATYPPPPRTASAPRALEDLARGAERAARLADRAGGLQRVRCG